MAIVFCHSSKKRRRKSFFYKPFFFFVKFLLFFDKKHLTNRKHCAILQAVTTKGASVHEQNQKSFVIHLHRPVPCHRSADPFLLHLFARLHQLEVHQHPVDVHGSTANDHRKGGHLRLRVSALGPGRHCRRGTALSAVSTSTITVVFSLKS